MSQRKEKYARRMRRLEMAQDRQGMMLSELQEAQVDVVRAGRMVAEAAGDVREIVERNKVHMKDVLAEGVYMAEEMAGCVKIALLAMGISMLSAVVTVITALAA